MGWATQSVRRENPLNDDTQIWDRMLVKPPNHSLVEEREAKVQRLSEVQFSDLLFGGNLQV